MWKTYRLRGYDRRFVVATGVCVVATGVCVVVVGYPTLSFPGHGGRPWSPSSRATLQGLDQRS